MKYNILPPKQLSASISLPASKSISNRILILNALGMNQALTENLSDCEDTRVLLDAFNSESNVFDIKGAGTAMRFLTAFLAGMEGDWIVKGSPRMHERPIHPLVNTLTALGAQIEYIEKEGFPPLRIRGTKLKGGEVYMSGNISSQFISALLMIAPTMENGIVIHLENEIISKPYIELTLELMAKYGIAYKWEGDDIVIRRQDYTPIPFRVEADWSAASYWYEMVSLIPNAQVTLPGLGKNSLQGDSNIANLFCDLGVSTEFTANGVVLRKIKTTSKKFFRDFVNEPDLAQTFAAACCFSNVPFLFSGLQSLKIKETDRIVALQKELRKLGFVLNEAGYGMLEWDGERIVKEDNPVIETYEDHRMAMALAPAAVVFGSVIINDPQVVSKSYPKFWDDLRTAGFIIEEME
ncbi:MAG: 3-phosphoshikimate 1-carboxyvinyltransferase [Dysgonamonadaceae bacterium]|jgi:3-phosphoshikimate 1-carboxyvinyltransferase|nr:3-phosphoshikimate 1-carboxyvinyltransferase [Dysgonamonadaceae bacterium]